MQEAIRHAILIDFSHESLDIRTQSPKTVIVAVCIFVVIFNDFFYFNDYNIYVYLVLQRLSNIHRLKFKLLDTIKVQRSLTWQGTVSPISVTV